jgi:Cof subfamily protein (haloacid dehalogenase superfamily)
MKRDIRLVFFDIDGTLVGTSGQISDTDKNAIRSLKAAGIRIAFASGRSLSGIAHINEELQFDAHSSLLAGSVIYHPRQQRIVESFLLPQQSASVLWHKLHQEQFYTESYTAHGIYILQENPFAAIHARYLQAPPLIVSDPLSYRGEQPIKFVVMLDSLTELDRLKTLMAAYPEYHLGIASGAQDPGLFFVNITAIDRAKVFQRILELEQVQAEHTMSFGDSESDLHFIREAGIGVAMSTAPQHVKAAANYIAPSVEDHGVSHALHELLF